ncbi:MAG: DUF58 domain-containing protein [Microbacterium sp.]|uniref:DUF58 domain-containing protein n=1 Tax=Microbacterium sp. TaxID=51671 RepID=UPI00260AC8D9|nr:DUF58 domain-containing protein [Microbacterium sp.]MCX6501881.1 DUF58 domain-containing protein [Microbacterium sp.]
MYVTGRLPLLVALGVVPVVLLTAAGVDPWLTAAGWAVLCLALTIGDAAAAADPRRLHVERRGPARARRDEDVTTSLLLRNDGPRLLRGLVRDAWQPTAGAPTRRLPVTVPSGERREVVVPLRPRRRGELRSGFIVVRSLGPLGVAGRQSVRAAPGSIRVLPPFTSRRHLPSRLARLRELDGSTSVQMRGPGTEFDSLREYVRGDDVRAIDWRATARAGTTMLRTWRPERDRQVVIVVDTGRTSAARVGDGVRLDAAMEAALLLGAVASAAGDHVHLLLMDRVVRGRVSGIDGTALLPAMVEALAPVEPQLIDTGWDAVVSQVRRLTTRPALVVLLTAQDDPDSSRSFLAALAPLTARTRVLVASATADDTASARARSGPRRADRRSTEDAYAAAAAERSRQDAEAVAAAIGRAGAVAVTDDVEALPPRVADHYLALKARGLL